MIKLRVLCDCPYRIILPQQLVNLSLTTLHLAHEEHVIREFVGRQKGRNTVQVERQQLRRSRMKEGENRNMLIIVSSGMCSNCVFSACRRRLRYINSSTSLRDAYLDETSHRFPLVQILRLLERIADHRHDAGDDVEVLQIHLVVCSDIHAMDVGGEDSNHDDDRQTADGPGILLRPLREEGVLGSLRLQGEEILHEGGALGECQNDGDEQIELLVGARRVIRQQFCVITLTSHPLSSWGRKTYSDLAQMNSKKPGTLWRKW